MLSAGKLIALVVFAFLLSACGYAPQSLDSSNSAPEISQPAATTDPITQFQASCMALAAADGNFQGMETCLDVANRLRASREPTQAAQTPPSTPQGPITWVARTPPINTAHINYGASDDNRAIFLHLNGPIERGDRSIFDRVAADALSRYPSATAVFFSLNSPGGSISEAAMIAEDVRRSDTPVVVMPHAQCASACFLIFASARTKLASRSAMIGVHSVIDGASGSEDTEAKAITTELARACAAVGVPPEIIGRMVSTPPGRVAWLSVSELASMDVRFLPQSAEF